MCVITSYNALCNLGHNIDEIYKNALLADVSKFALRSDIIKGRVLRVGEASCNIQDFAQNIKNLTPKDIINYNLRCNKMLLEALEPLLENIKKYRPDDIALVVATTNSGIEEYSKSKNPEHFELANPALFLKKYLGLKNFYTTISTACSSGLKAFSLARDLIRSKIAKAVVVAGVDSLAKLPLFGFSSLEILSPEQSLPFSKNYTGINISEGCGVFLVEDITRKGIKIAGIGETTDSYHTTTPDPEGCAEAQALNIALNDAGLTPLDIDYINLHGTGTFANDKMEAHIVKSIFKNVPASSTKPMTGHCLGAAASVEIALCCHLLKNFGGQLFEHVYDGQYNPDIDKIRLIQRGEKFKKCDIILKNSFGFSGSSTAIVLGRNYAI